MLRAVVFGAVLGAAVASPASAQFLIPGITIQAQPTPRQQREQVRPYIIALSDCVAKRVLDDDAGVIAFRDNGFSPYVRSMIDRCPRYVEQLAQVYDQTYGAGQGQTFIYGPYAADLPRAVLKRIQPQLQAKLDTLRQDEAAQVARDAQAKAEADEQARQAEANRQREAADQAERDARANAEAEARQRQAEADQQRQAAEAEQRAAIAKADAEKAQAQERAAAQVAEAERLKQVEVANGAAKLLAAKTLDCGKEQLKSLVKSGESAEVLASAVMTMCDTEVDHFVEAGVKEYNLEHQLRDDDNADGLVREKIKADTREHLMALAVQAKAGVGGFAPASSN